MIERGFTVFNIIHHIAIIVSDIHTAKTFYVTKLGLDVYKRQVWISPIRREFPRSPLWWKGSWRNASWRKPIWQMRWRSILPSCLPFTAKSLLRKTFRWSASPIPNSANWPIKDVYKRQIYASYRSHEHGENRPRQGHPRRKRSDEAFPRGRRTIAACPYKTLWSLWGKPEW